MKKDLSVDGLTGINFTGSIIENSTLDCQGNKISSNTTDDTFAVDMPADSKNNIIKNCTFTDYDVGIYLHGSSGSPIVNITIANNTFYDIVVGIAGLYTTNNTIDNNNIINCSGTTGGFLFIVGGNNYNTIKNNNITNCSGIGMFMYGGNENQLTNNIFRYNQDNIQLGATTNTGIINGSIDSATRHDYDIDGGGATIYFRNTNFTNPRTIDFGSANNWFNYQNSSGGIWLNTTNSESGNITRNALTNLNNTLCQWNDSDVLTCWY